MDKCSGCGVEVRHDYVRFKCPSCGGEEVRRCKSCRTLGNKYTCGKCGFVGP